MLKNIHGNNILLKQNENWPARRGVDKAALFGVFSALNSGEYQFHDYFMRVDLLRKM